jgi:hypothetical protein
VSFHIFLGCVFLLFLGMAIVLYRLLNDDTPNPTWNTTPNRQSLISTPRIVDHSVDPDARLLHIFVMPSAISDFVIGHMPFTEEAQGISNIKLVRSGTGFRVYNHPTVKEGQWLPCR